MALSAMTGDWKEAANSITLYVLRRRRENEAKLIEEAANPIRLYNTWVHETGVVVDDAERALWCVEYMQSLVRMDTAKLTAAAQIDGLI